MFIHAGTHVNSNGSVPHSLALLSNTATKNKNKTECCIGRHYLGIEIQPAMLLCMCKIVCNETLLSEQPQEPVSGVKGTKQKRTSLKKKHVPLLAVFLNSFYPYERNIIHVCVRVQRSAATTSSLLVMGGFSFVYVLTRHVPPLQHARRGERYE